MSNRSSQKLRYGDFCFREPYLGMPPERIRRLLEDQARDQIRRSRDKGVSFFACDWPWLSAPA
jgi:hypothetical protein